MKNRNKKMSSRVTSGALAVALLTGSLIPVINTAKAAGVDAPSKTKVVIQKTEYKFKNLDRKDVLQDKNKTGHATVHDGILEGTDGKFDSKDRVAKERDTRLGDLEEGDQGILNTGDEFDTAKLYQDFQVKAYSPELYGDVEFTVYKLQRSPELLEKLTPKEAQYKLVDGNLEINKETQLVAAKAQMKATKVIADEILAAKDGVLPYGATKVETKELDASGKVEFDLDSFTTSEDGKKENAIYIAVETKSPETVVGKSNPMLIYLPVANGNEAIAGKPYILRPVDLNGKSGSFKSTVHLYPKNEVKEVTFGFEKHKTENDQTRGSDDGVLKGAKFKVYKGTPAQHEQAVALQIGGKDVVVETDDKGQIDITGLVRGQYFLVEQEVADLVDGVTAEATNYQKREGFKYLAGYDSLLNKYNGLTFNVGKDGVVRTGSELDKGEKLDNVSLMKYTNHFVPEFDKKLTAYGVDQTRAKEPRQLKSGFDYFANIPFELKFVVPDNIHEYSKFEGKDQLERLGHNSENKEIDFKKTSDEVNPTSEAEYVLTKDGRIKFDVQDEKGTNLEENVDYWISDFDKEQNNKFKISFVNPEKADMKAEEVTKINNRFSEKVLKAQTITVKYHAQLEATAAPDVVYNNRAEFTFNNAPEKDLTKDRYEHKGEKFQTFGKQFIKTDAGVFGSGLGTEGLAGAEFIVKNEQGEYFMGYTHNENKQGLEEAVWKSFSSDQEAYDAIKKGKNSAEAILVSGKDGKFEIRGLEEGNYVLVEMKQPVGYLLPINPETKFEVKKNTYSSNIQGSDVVKAEAQTIKNERSPEMPLTGSEKLATGIAVSVVAGTAMFIIFASRKRREVSAN